MLEHVPLAANSRIDEGRAFLNAVFQTTVDLLPCQQRKQLVVHFHSMAQPRFIRALQALCEFATSQQTVYPGTDLKMVYEAPIVASKSLQCYEL